MAATFIADGVGTFDFLTADELGHYHAAIANFKPPEFESVAGGPLALGAFQGLNYASSWHNTEVARPLRLLADERLRPLIADTLGLPRHHGLANLQQLPDRMLVREPHTAVAREQWHRDAPKVHDEGDYVLGGWINLDAPGTPPQRFICVPGSHTGVALPSGRGFEPVRDPAANADYFARERHYAVAPGQVIMFYSHIMHRIASSDGVPHRTHRLFLGWRLTNSARPLIADLAQRLDAQDIVPLPSAQLAPLHPKNYISYFDVNRQRLENFAARLVPKLRRKYVHKKTGCVHTIPVHRALSLRQLNSMYPAYTDREKSILGVQ